MKIFNPISALSVIFSFLMAFSACQGGKSITSDADRKEKDLADIRLALPATAPLPAQTDNANSLLWEISREDMEMPSYLFGTIHLIGLEDFFMTDLVKDRFYRTQQLVLEIDMDDPTMPLIAISGAFMKDGHSLRSLLSKEEYDRLADYFEDNLGLDLAMFNKMKPILLSTMITEESVSGEVTSYELEFMEMASKRGMEVLGLESAAFQMSVFDSIPYDQQARMLMDGLDGKGDNSIEIFDRMVELYKNEELDALHGLIAEESEDIGKFDYILLDQRNANWIPKIEEMIREKPSFFAVGAAHLSGDSGVISLLLEKGYTLIPLKQIEE